MFSYFLITGFAIGLLLYACVSWIFPSLTPKKRAIAIASIGILTLMGSVFFGFTGMLYGMLGFGIVAVGLFLLLFARYTWVTKSLYVCIGLLIAGTWAQYAFVDNDYWIIRKTPNEQVDDVDRYRSELQENEKLRGYKVFTISEGAKAIVLSLGNKQKGSNIEVVDVKNQDGTTKINVRTFSNGSPERNPYIMIGFDHIEQDIQIIDTDGTMYPQLQ